MFARKFRLPPTVKLRQAKFVQTQGFSLKIAQNMLSYNRYGFVVAKAIDKRATVRNRLKRRFRSCVEKAHAKIPAGNDFLFVLKKEALTITTEELANQINFNI